jgi:AraC family transcriptional activator FtrA
MTHLVAALAYDLAPAFELAIPGEIFALDIVQSGYQFMLIGAEPGPLRTSSGWSIRTDGDLGCLDQADTIIVPGWRDPAALPSNALIESLRRAAARGARIASLCTGAFVLAAAGLLDGRRATTHWRHAAQLARRYPKIEVDPDVLYVDAGGVLTSGGTAAGLDLCLHLVRLDHGASLANAVARRLLVAPHREGGQAQFAEAAVATESETARLGQSLAELSGSLGEPWSLARLAASASLSVRQYHRVFQAATGATPHQWLLGQRVRAGQRLLEDTSLSIEEVGIRVGFGSPSSFRSHFVRLVHTSPSAYRQTFRVLAPPPTLP